MYLVCLCMYLYVSVCIVYMTWAFREYVLRVSCMECQCSLIETLYDFCQLAARGTKERALLGWLFFLPEFFILKTIMFREVTTVLNERKHLEMVIRSVPDSVSLILGRTEWLGHTALHSAQQLKLLCQRTFLKCWCS